MPCTSLAPELDLAGRARYVSEHLPPGLFRVVDDTEETVAWRVSPAPFALAPHTVEAITTLGDDLLAFYRALNALYLRSARGTAPAFIAEELDRGKPEQMQEALDSGQLQNMANLPIKRLGRPEDIAYLALFLASDVSGYITGQLISVSGGVYMP